MSLLFVVAFVIQSIAISLGVGCSTLAITNFFVAIADGKINPDERRMMGIVYVFLRIAMILIMVTTSTLLVVNYLQVGSASLSAYTLAQFTLIFVLFMNAILMTAKLMPSTVGPALQASTWYTFGVTTALFAIDLAKFTPLQFLLGYITVFVLAVSLVNGLMVYLKNHHSQPKSN